MADDVLTLTLEPYTAARLAERAAAMGVTPEELASLILDARFFDYDDLTWLEGDAQDASLHGQTVHETGRPWSEVRPEYMALIDRNFGKPS